MPIDLWGCASKIHTDLYLRIAQHLGLDGLGDLVRPGTTCEYVDYRISDLIDADLRHVVIGRPKNFASHVDENGNTIDEWGIGRKHVSGYWQITHHPLANAAIDEIDHHKWPVIKDVGRVEKLRDQAGFWRHNTDFAISATSPTSGLIFEFCQYLRGTEQFLVDLYTDEQFARKLIERVADVLAELYVYYITPIAEYLDWVEYSADFGTQNGPFISPETFHRFFREPHIRVFEAVKQVAPNAKTFLHSCGSIRLLIPEFIECGVEILNPLQPLARGMDLFEIKKEFGKDLIFHGGVDLQQALAGTVEDTIADTKKRIRALAPGGGYICAPANHFQPDVSIDNFFAMYRTAVEYGKYPLTLGE